MTSRAVALTFLFLGLNTLAFAQAAPAVTASAPTYNPGIVMPLIDGNFQYALSASELFQSGYYTNGVGNTTSLSGDLEYTSRNEHTPFEIMYAGGYLLTNNNGSESSTFQSLMISQGLIRGPWSLSISDAVSFLPNAPTTGLAGVPGVGDLGLPVQQGSDIPSQDVLTDYARRVSNAVSGSISRQLNGRTSITATGSYGGLYFLDGNGLTTTQESGSVSLNRQLDRRNTVGVTASYSAFNYGGATGGFHTRGISGYYTRIWSRRVTTNVSFGPQWISAFSSTTTGTDGPVTTTVPSRVTFGGSASVSYTRRSTTASLAYSRSVNGGSGVQMGAIGDVVSAGLTRAFGRDWSTGVNANYARTNGLANGGNTNTFFAGVQANRRLGQHLSAFVSYTFVDQQLYSGLVGPSSFSGVSNTGAIGITFSPRAARLGQF